jgi:hypothetical protein
MFELYEHCKQKLDRLLRDDTGWTRRVFRDDDNTLRIIEYLLNSNTVYRVQISSEGEGVQVNATLPESALTDLDILVKDGQTFREAIIDDDAIVTMAVLDGTTTRFVKIYPMWVRAGMIAFEVEPQNDKFVLESLFACLIRYLRTHA